MRRRPTSSSNAPSWAEPAGSDRSRKANCRRAEAASADAIVRPLGRGHPHHLSLLVRENRLSLGWPPAHASSTGRGVDRETRTLPDRVGDTLPGIAIHATMCHRRMTDPVFRDHVCLPAAGAAFAFLSRCHATLARLFAHPRTVQATPAFALCAFKLTSRLRRFSAQSRPDRFFPATGPWPTQH